MSRFEEQAKRPGDAGVRPSSRAGLFRAGAWQGVLVLLAGMVGSLFLNLALRQEWPLPFCVLRRFTGVPCPACGCTRSLAAWSAIDPAAAIRFNPLFFAACVGVACWVGLGLVDAARGTTLAARAAEALVRMPRRWGVGLVLLNWLYLCVWLPK